MMISSLFTRFILWLKKILHIRLETEHKVEPVKIPQQPEEKSIEVTSPEEKPRGTSSEEEKPAERPLSEKKTTEVTLLVEQRPPAISSEKEPREQLREEILRAEPSQGLGASSAIEEIETELQIKQLTEGVKTEERITKKEEEDTPRPPKPYKKTPPTEARKGGSIKQPPTKREPPSLQRKEATDLGGIQKTRRRLTGVQRESQSDSNIDKEKTDKAREEKELAISIESPFVEINLDEADVYLVLPQQQLKANRIYELPQWLSYELELNGKQREVLVKAATDKDGHTFTEGKRISLEEPLFKFQVAFPDELQGRKYVYNHSDKGLYAFVAIGNNRGRMSYLYDEDGNANPLPKRVIWILLDEEFELQTETALVEERWIWERYQPFRVDLNKIDALVVKDRSSGKEMSFCSQSTFRVEGEQLIEDDFKKECPLFAGKSLTIAAPYENQFGWRIWILCKVVGAQIVSKNWTGKEPIALNCPKDLPCDCGEFQIDICQQDTRIPDETFFFRWMPRIELTYPKELIIPDPKLGHIPSTISVKFDSDEWEFKAEGSQEAESMHDNFYQLKLPPERDTVRFCIAKQGRPETIVNFQVTIPRLKWKTSKQDTWDGRFQEIERRDLKSGESFYLLVQTNDFENKYDLRALLETNSQRLQEGKFIRNGMEYSLELNQFFDTIKHNQDELRLKVEIRENAHSFTISEVCMLDFLPPVIHCKFCNFEVHGMAKLIYHFEECHFHDMTEPITYEEMREYDKYLPHKIHRCCYCDFYSREDDLMNITSSICQHIQEDCPNVNRKSGPVRISFMVISKIDEIRRNVIPGLPQIDKCKLCGIHFRDYDRKAKVAHFLKKHEIEICTNCGR